MWDGVSTRPRLRSSRLRRPDGLRPRPTYLPPAQRGRVLAEKLAPPPRAGAPPLLARGEPVLPTHRAHRRRRRIRERIAGEQAQHRRLVLQQPLLGAENEA